MIFKMKDGYNFSLSRKYFSSLIILVLWIIICFWYRGYTLLYYSNPLVEAARVETRSGKGTIKILTWNTQGLLRDKLEARTKAILSVIRRENPDGIFFQELIPSTFTDISESLQDEYGSLRDTDAYSNYFTGIFYNRTQLRLMSQKILRFPNTVMGRALQIATFAISGPQHINLALMTTHLESLRQSKGKRVEQLRESFAICDSFPDSFNVVFGGDLNLEDGEDSSIQLERVKDTWKECGSDSSTKFTWDSTVNFNDKMKDINQQPKTRYDRLYFRSSKPETMRLRKFQLLGKEAVQGTEYFPSDHWAIMLTFQLVGSKQYPNITTSHDTR